LREIFIGGREDGGVEEYESQENARPIQTKEHVIISCNHDSNQWEEILKNFKTSNIRKMRRAKIREGVRPPISRPFNWVGLLPVICKWKGDH
jgi:hypothetical protein